MKDVTIKKRIRIAIKDDCSIAEIMRAAVGDCACEHPVLIPTSQHIARARRLVIEVFNNCNLTERQARELDAGENDHSMAAIESSRLKAGASGI